MYLYSEISDLINTATDRDRSDLLEVRIFNTDA